MNNIFNHHIKSYLGKHFFSQNISLISIAEENNKIFEVDIAIDSDQFKKVVKLLRFNYNFYFKEDCFLASLDGHGEIVISDNFINVIPPLKYNIYLNINVIKQSLFDGILDRYIKDNFGFKKLQFEEVNDYINKLLPLI